MRSGAAGRDKSGVHPTDLAVSGSWRPALDRCRQEFWSSNSGVHPMDSAPKVLQYSGSLLNCAPEGAGGDGHRRRHLRRCPRPGLRLAVQALPRGPLLAPVVAVGRSQVVGGGGIDYADRVDWNNPEPRSATDSLRLPLTVGRCAARKECTRKWRVLKY